MVCNQVVLWLIDVIFNLLPCQSARDQISPPQPVVQA